MKLRKTAFVKEILAKSFPTYKGRKFQLSNERDSVYFDPYGGGGTFSKYVLIDMATGRAEPYRYPVGGPFHDGSAYRSVPLPVNVVLAEHVIFQGHDLGIRFHVNPATALPSDVTEQVRLANAYRTVALEGGR